MFRYLDSNEPPFYGNNLLYNASAFAVASTLNDRDKKKHHKNSNPVSTNLLSSNKLPTTNFNNSILERDEDYYNEEYMLDEEYMLEDEYDRNSHEEPDYDGLTPRESLHLSVDQDLNRLRDDHEGMNALFNSNDSDNSSNSSNSSRSSILQKYIKYKTKYINLKNKINLKL